MFDLLKIKLFGRQSVPNISDRRLNTLIKRYYKNNSDIVRAKLRNINSDSRAGRNRIAAGILKLADKNLGSLDELIKRADTDSRDIMMWAEYPRGCAKTDLETLRRKEMKQIYIEDFIEYSDWLNKGFNQ